MSEDAQRALLSYDWYGNVRELENMIKRLLVLTSDSVITKETLLDIAPPLEGGIRGSCDSLDKLITNEIKLLLDGSGEGSSVKVYEEMMRKVEKPLIKSVLAVTKGNKKKAASLLA